MAVHQQHDGRLLRPVGRLRRNAAFTEVGTGHHGTTEWAEFTIPADQWNPASGAKRKTRPLTDGEKARASAHLAHFRVNASVERAANQNGSPNPTPEPISTPERQQGRSEAQPEMIAPPPITDNEPDF